MRYLLLFSIILITEISSGQNKVLSKIPATGNSIQVFIPEGYDTLSTVTGDLNKDGVDDYVLVLRSKAEDTVTAEYIGDLPGRVLVILFKKGTAFEVGAKTDKMIMCRYCGGFRDPFDNMAIEKGVLRIQHYGGSSWRWSQTHKFRYQQNDFYLIGETNYQYWSVSKCEALGEFAATDYSDVNFITGAYEEKKVSEEGCKLLVNKKGKQKILPLKKLTALSLEN